MGTSAPRDGHLRAPRRGGAHPPATLYQIVNGEREVHPPFFRYGDERSRSVYCSYISTATRAFDMTHRTLLFDSPLLATGPDPLINPSLLFLFPPCRSKLHFSFRHCSPKPLHACLVCWEPIAPRWVSALRPTYFRSCLASLLRAFAFPFSFPVSLHLYTHPLQTPLLFLAPLEAQMVCCRTHFRSQVEFCGLCSSLTCTPSAPVRDSVAMIKSYFL